MGWIIVGIVCIVLGCIILFSNKENSDIPGLFIIFLSSMILSIGIISVTNKNESSTPIERNNFIEKVIILDNNKDTVSITYIYKKDSI